MRWLETSLKTAMGKPGGRDRLSRPKGARLALRTYPRTAAGALCGRRIATPSKTLGSALRFARDEEAATAVEYAVMLALILGAVIGSIGAVGQTTGGMWGNNESQLKAVGFVP